MQDILIAVRKLYEWQCAGATHFTAHVYELIAKADLRNREKIRRIYPSEVFVYEEWQQAKDPREFFIKYKIIDSEGVPT